MQEVSVVVYVLAFIGLVTVAILLWKAFGPQLSARDQGPVVGPDDDPEFLWRMSRDVKRNRGEDER